MNLIENPKEPDTNSFALNREDALRLYKYFLNSYVSYEDSELIKLIRKIGKFANELPG